jgi:kynurenine formamidase
MTEPKVLPGLVSALATRRIEIIDLTHTLSPNFPTIVLPPELGQCQPVRIEEVSRYDPRGPAWYWNTVTFGEHAGTHFDAPIHWISGRYLPNNSVDTVPPQDFVASAVVVDCSAEAAADDDFLLDCIHIDRFEAEHGMIAPRSWVLMRSDWSKKQGAAYVNLRNDGAHSPGVTAKAISFLVHRRDILGFGVETIGTDAGQAQYLNPPFPAHTILHGHGRFGLQCLTGLDRLPPTGAVLIATPLKIRQGSGSPVRVLALVER